MIGKKEKGEPTFHYFHMANLVPDDHILKVIDKHIDFSFIRERVRHLYSHTGRPSVDPEVMVRMLLVGYLFGITSERRLCEEVAMHIGYRWFVGLNMEDAVPDHSTFSKNRHGRFRESGLWEEVFDEVVRRCMEAGLVRGKHVTADGTLVEANASLNSMEQVVVEMKPGEYLRKVKEENPIEEVEDEGFRKKGTKMSNSTHRSTTDPDARIARKSDFSDTKLAYQVSYLMDNSSRVILDAVVTGEAGRGVEMEQALAGLDRAKWKYRLEVETLGGDKGYAAGGFIRQTYSMGVVPHVPVYDTRSEHDKGIYPIEAFTYDSEKDLFTCPQGKQLKYHGKNHRQVTYRASMKDCVCCQARSECTRDRARSVSFHIYHEYIERAKEEKKTVGYKLSQRCRKKIEELFGEAKELMGMRRMKFRGRATVKEQILLTAAAQNIKRLIRYLERGVPKPAVAVCAARPDHENSPVKAFLKPILALLEDFFDKLLLNVNSAKVFCLK
ncbi:MAG: IS1182 family transposase [bacterium]